MSYVASALALLSRQISATMMSEIVERGAPSKTTATSWNENNADADGSYHSHMYPAWAADSLGTRAPLSSPLSRAERIFGQWLRRNPRPHGAAKRLLGLRIATA